MSYMTHDDELYETLANKIKRVLAAVVSGDANELSVGVVLGHMQYDYDEISQLVDRTCARLSQESVSMGGPPLSLAGFEARPTWNGKKRVHVVEMTLKREAA